MEGSCSGNENPGLWFKTYYSCPDDHTPPNASPAYNLKKIHCYKKLILCMIMM